MTHLSRPLQALCRLVTALLAVLSLTFSLSTLGSSAWRTFPIWLFALASFYFLLTAAFTILNLPFIPTSSSTVEGSLLVSLMLSLLTLCSGTASFQLPLPALICGQVLLPLSLLFNYLCLSSRLPWSWSRPYGFLLLPLLYFAITLATIAILPATTPLLIPFSFLDLTSLGIIRVLLVFILLGVFGLIVGYLLQVAQLIIDQFEATRTNLPASSVHRKAKQSARHVSRTLKDVPYTLKTTRYASQTSKDVSKGATAH